MRFAHSSMKTDKYVDFTVSVLWVAFANLLHLVLERRSLSGNCEL